MCDVLLVRVHVIILLLLPRVFSPNITDKARVTNTVPVSISLYYSRSDNNNVSRERQIQQMEKVDFIFSLFLSFDFFSNKGKILNLLFKKRKNNR